MPPAQLLSFSLCSAALIVAPGPDILSVISYGISQGRRSGMFFGAGCAIGCLLHTFWLAVGLSAMIAASDKTFTVLKIIGALYLFYLAYRAFRSGGPLNLQTAATPPLPGRVYFRRGFLANTLNPKVALFIVAFLPQFTGPGHLSLSVQFLFLGTLFTLLSLAIFLLVGAFSGAVGSWLKSHANLGGWLDRLAGVIFLALGLRLLWTQATVRN